MEYKTINGEELDTFIWEATQNGGMAIGIKGDPPDDATDEDGEPITSWNVAWMDSITKKKCEIIRVAKTCDWCGYLGNVKQGDICPKCSQ